MEKGGKSDFITFDTENWKRSSNHKTHSMHRYLCVKKRYFKFSLLENRLFNNLGQNYYYIIICAHKMLGK